MSLSSEILNDNLETAKMLEDVGWELVDASQRLQESIAEYRCRLGTGNVESIAEWEQEILADADKLEEIILKLGE